MKLDRIAAVLRPRKQWEAVDLGVVLMRRFYKPVLAAWMFSVLPACMLIFAITANNPWLALLLIRLLRPVFERVPLFVLSRALFGAVPTLGETLRMLPKLWTRDPWGGLVLNSISPVRSLIMPISELEGLRGKERMKRQSLISLTSGGSGFALGLICLLFELAIVAAGIALIALMIPEHLKASYDWERLGGFTWELWLLRGLYLVAITAISPLYVACGFALYINRRTQLEGWDIELGLRGIGQRLRKQAASLAGSAGACLLFTILAMSFGARPALAQEGEYAATPGEVIAEVLAHEDFDRMEVSVSWELPEPDSDDGSELLLSLAARLFEVLLWGAAIALLFFLIYQACKRLGWISVPVHDAKVTKVSPRELFGLDLRPETLPADIPGAAWRLWQEGDEVGALGLLYRAAISRLVEHDALELTDSDTESDCLRRVRKLANLGRADYFASVTTNWQVCAYSTDQPSDIVVRELCDAWPESFDGGQP